MSWTDIDGKVSINDGNFFIEITLDDRVMYVQYTGEELQFYDSNGLEYASELYLEDYGDPIAATQAFIQEQREDNSGFVSDGEEAEGEQNDMEFPDLLQQLRQQAKPERKLLIHTYGNKFKQYKNYSATERNFNARVIRSSRSGLNTKNP